jgi:hypothetical protein
MYPATFFGLFPSFPLNRRAFVAMSFDHRFDARWETVLRPGIATVPCDGQYLDPDRIDLTMSGDSVVTGILKDLSQCRVIVADITSLGTHERRTVRNENVLYEVGLAHAVRLPEEVILFRSDHDPLAFDISNVRVHEYDPDGNPAEALTRVRDVIAGSLQELDLRRHLTITRAAAALNAADITVLSRAQSTDTPVVPPVTLGHAVTIGSAISRLLEIGALCTEFRDPSGGWPTAPQMRDDVSFIRYRTTPLGTALFEHVRERMGFGGSQSQQLLIDAFSVDESTESVSAAEAPSKTPSQEGGSQAQPSESS